MTTRYPIPLDRPLRAVLSTTWITLVVIALALSSSARAADPFYEEQLRRGRRAYELGELEEASRALRVAAFGLLEEPDVLADALLFLALTQAARGDQEGFSSTFERIAEIEDRFSAYSNLGEPQARSAFESFVARWIPPDHLRLTPGFEALAGQLATAEEIEVKPAVKRRQLRRQLEQSPGNVEILQALAKLELEQGKESRALAYIEDAVSLAPESVDAHCQRIGIAAAMDRCGPALASAAACDSAAFGQPADEFLLSCLADREMWTEARGVLSQLTAGRRAEPPIATIALLVEEHLGPAEEMAGEQAASEAPEEQAERPDPERSTLSPEDAAAAARIRQLTRSAVDSTDLDEPTRLATELVDRNPDSTEALLLAAEVAYRASNWQEAASLFRRAGEPDATQPLLLFYFAVSLFESGERQAAAEALRPALPELTRTQFVENYVQRILGE